MNEETDYLVSEVPFIPDDGLCFVNEIELSFRPVYPKMEQSVIKKTEDSYKALFPFYEGLINIQELFVVLYLNRSNKIIGIYSASKGGITGTVADIRLILSVGLKCLATAMIISHNHPSGSLTPSPQDEHLTAKIKQAAELMEIRLLDHVIIIAENGRFFSFAEEGLL
ncbi:MAG: JAB domain-containing protein [Bacteroidota bacterium]